MVMQARGDVVHTPPRAEAACVPAPPRDIVDRQAIAHILCINESDAIGPATIRAVKHITYLAWLDGTQRTHPVAIDNIVPRRRMDLLLENRFDTLIQGLRQHTFLLANIERSHASNTARIK